MKDDKTRRQIIRDAVREMLPEVLHEVVKNQQYELLTKKVETRLGEVEKYKEPIYVEYKMFLEGYKKALKDVLNELKEGEK